MSGAQKGKRLQVLLLDGRSVDVRVQARFLTSELLSLAATHFNLKDLEYFGLAHINEGPEQQLIWLQEERPVLDHDCMRVKIRSKRVGGDFLQSVSSSPSLTSPGSALSSIASGGNKNKRTNSTHQAAVPRLYFLVRFFVPSITIIKDPVAVYLFFLQTQQKLYQEQLRCEPSLVFELAALVLQSLHGDFVNEVLAREQLSELPLLPTYVLQQHPDIAFCEQQVLAHYRCLAGNTSQGMAVVNYMALCERLPMYGITYYPVRDKSKIPWMLGLSSRGIGQYDFNDKSKPRKFFRWRQIENIYYRDKKFSMDVREVPRSSKRKGSTGRLLSFSQADVTVHTWLSKTCHLAKDIWLAAVAQHKWHLIHQRRTAYWNEEELAAKLSSLRWLRGRSYLTRARSSLRDGFDSPASEQRRACRDKHRRARLKMLGALKAKRDVINDTLERKLAELRSVCLKEGELVGRLPDEYPLRAGEAKPAVRLRRGATFRLPEEVLKKEPEDEEEEDLLRLEMEFELQKQIVSAAHKLAQEKNLSKYVQKQRVQSYDLSMRKLEELEKDVRESKAASGCVAVSTKQRGQLMHEYRGSLSSVTSGASSNSKSSAPSFVTDSSGTEAVDISMTSLTSAGSVGNTSGIESQNTSIASSNQDAPSRIDSVSNGNGTGRVTAPVASTAVTLDNCYNTISQRLSCFGSLDASATQPSSACSTLRRSSADQLSRSGSLRVTHELNDLGALDTLSLQEGFASDSETSMVSSTSRSTPFGTLRRDGEQTSFISDFDSDSTYDTLERPPRPRTQCVGGAGPTRNVRSSDDLLLQLPLRTTSNEATDTAPDANSQESTNALHDPFESIDDVVATRTRRVFVTSLDARSPEPDSGNTERVCTETPASKTTSTSVPVIVTFAAGEIEDTVQGELKEGRLTYNENDVSSRMSNSAESPKQKEDSQKAKTETNEDIEKAVENHVEEPSLEASRPRAQQEQKRESRPNPVDGAPVHLRLPALRPSRFGCKRYSGYGVADFGGSEVEGESGSSGGSSSSDSEVEDLCPDTPVNIVVPTLHSERTMGVSGVVHHSNSSDLFMALMRKSPQLSKTGKVPTMPSQTAV